MWFTLNNQIQLKFFLYAFVLLRLPLLHPASMTIILEDSLIIPLCVFELYPKVIPLTFSLHLNYFSYDRLICIHFLLQSLSLILNLLLSNIWEYPSIEVYALHSLLKYFSPSFSLCVYPSFPRLRSLSNTPWLNFISFCLYILPSPKVLFLPQLLPMRLPEIEVTFPFIMELSSSTHNLNNLR